MKNKYFICEHLHKTQVVHGTICNVDAEHIFMENGYQPIRFPYIYDFSAKAKLARFLYLLRMLLAVPTGATVVFQFPLYARIHMLLLKLLRWKNVRIICMIADIEGLRNLDDELLQKEMNAFKKFRWFIIHNERMAEWLLSVVPGARFALIEFFDFKTSPIKTSHSKSGDVVFAGNLEKSPFVYSLGKLHSPIQFNIYGPGWKSRAIPALNVSYKGVFEVHQVINQLQGSFGLVWDGDSIDTCAGRYGEYLAYNSPHKLSLYILAGLPLVVPAMAASALLVKKYGIGITIHSLHELDAAIGNISDEEYQQMIDNMQPLAQRIKNGQCLGDALGVMENAISPG